MMLFQILVSTALCSAKIYVYMLHVHFGFDIL